MKQVKCKQCGIILDSNIYALNRKLFGRAVKEAICISCMADYFSCDTEDLLTKIEELKEQGCTLFN